MYLTALYSIGTCIFIMRSVNGGSSRYVRSFLFKPVYLERDKFSSKNSSMG